MRALTQLLGDDRAAAAQLKTPSLRHDDRGAMMVMGLYVAVFLVGLLYYIVGIGDAIIYREAMQETADVGAFAAAVVNSRGMNIIVLMNLIMAVIMAVLLSMKVIKILIIGAIALLGGIGLLCGGCTAPAIAFLYKVQNVVTQAENAFEPVAKAAIRILNAAQIGVKYVWPGVAQGRSINAMASDSSGGFSGGVPNSPASAGITFPFYAALPVEEDRFAETCFRGSMIGGEIIAAPFGAIHRKVREFVAGAVEGLYMETAQYFCDGGEPPSIEFDEDVAQPETARSKACQSACRDSNMDQCAPCSADPNSDSCSDAITQICFRSQRDDSISGPQYCAPGRVREGAGVDFNSNDWCEDSIEEWDGCYDPDRQAIRDQRLESDGSITPLEPIALSSIRSMCSQRVESAIESCGDGNRVYVTEESRYIAYYGEMSGETCLVRSVAFNGEAVADEEGNSGLDVNRRTDVRHGRSVCPNGGYGYREAPFGVSACPFVTDDGRAVPDNYQDVIPPYGSSPGDLQAACRALPASQPTSLRNARSSQRANSLVTVRVYHVHRCSTRSTRVVEMEHSGTADDEWKGPQRVCRYSSGGRFVSTNCADDGDQLWLGDSDFQIRSVAAAFGTEQDSVADEGVRVATWNEATQGPLGIESAGSSSLGSLGIARGAARISLAQAEFFWDQSQNCNDNGGHCEGYRRRTRPGGGAPPEIEWMWDMSWNARLRRVHFGSDEDAGEQASDQSSALGSLASGVLDAINGVILH